MVQFVQATVEKPDVMVGVSFEDGGTIGQLPGIIGEYVQVFRAVGPSAGRVDHGVAVGVDANGVTYGNFHQKESSENGGFRTWQISKIISLITLTDIFN
jgi:hypothetical protein